MSRLFSLELELQETLAEAQCAAASGENGKLQLQHTLKEKKQNSESLVEEMLEKNREAQTQEHAKQVELMNELQREQDEQLKEVVESSQAALAEQRKLLLSALQHEADAETEAKGKLQALSEQHALAVAISCLKAATEKYYHEAVAEEKERSQLELLAIVEDDEQLAEVQERATCNIALLKDAAEEEAKCQTSALQAAFKQHQETCIKARENIRETHRLLMEHTTLSVCFLDISLHFMVKTWCNVWFCFLENKAVF